MFTRDKQLVVRGIVSEILDRLAGRGGTGQGWRSGDLYGVSNDPEQLVPLLIEMLQESGAETWLRAAAVAVARKGDRITHLVIETAGGRQAVAAEVVVDATGDASVAFAAGAHCEYTPPGSDSLEIRLGGVDLQRFYEYISEHPDEYPEGYDFADGGLAGFQRNWLEHGVFWWPHGGGTHLSIVQAAVDRGEWKREDGLARGLDSFGMYGIRQSPTVIINTGFYAIDDLDVRLSSQAELQARHLAPEVACFVRAHFPGFENSYIAATASYFGVRRTRHICGDYTLTAVEADSGVRFADVVAVMPSRRRGLGGRGQGFMPYSHDLPLRVLLPQGTEGLIAASGKAISTSPPAIRRSQVHCLQLGQAAGVTAAKAAQAQVTPRHLQTSIIQRALLDQGVFLGDTDRLTELRVL